MFKPARMARVLVGGHKTHQEAVIDTLYREGAVHLEDYKDEANITRIGEPLPAGDAASALLVRVRGLRKALGVEAMFGKALATENPSALLEDAEQAVLPVMDRVGDLRAELARVTTEANAIHPFTDLDVDLSMVHGLTAVRGYMGTVKSDPGPRLAADGIPHEIDVRPSEHGLTLTLFVPAAHAGAAEAALGSVGYSPAAIPSDAEGTPRTALETLASERASLEASVKKQEGELEKLRESWGARLAALERALSTDVEKTQAPLHFGVTDATFHLEGWVPKDRLNRVLNALSAKFGESLYVQELGDAPANHGHEDHDDHGHGSDPEDEAPVHLEHKGLAKPYLFLLGLLGRPRYREIDPTILLAVFFPLFFGFMVGDMAVGLLIVLFGWYLKKNYVMGIGGPAVGKMLMAGGVIAIALGLVLFGEALGIHFVVSNEALEDGEMSWESVIFGKEEVLAGHGFPEEGFIHKAVESHGGPGADPHATDPNAEHSAPAITTHAESAEAETSMFSMAPHGTTHLSVGGMFNLGYYSKIHDIQALLIISLLVALVHMVLGFLIGVRNVYIGHGAKLAIQEKVAWLTLMAGFAVLIVGLSGSGTIFTAAGAGIIVTSIALLWAGAQHVLGAGFVAVLEVFGLVGNVLSYTRLAAVAASKAGMALAFAALGFDIIGGFAGWIVYLLGMIVITLLAILTGALHSLRLQFVEFFGKFFEGGGRPYKPLGGRFP